MRHLFIACEIAGTVVGVFACVSAVLFAAYEVCQASREWRQSERNRELFRAGRALNMSKREILEACERLANDAQGIRR